MDDLELNEDSLDELSVMFTDITQDRLGYMLTDDDYELLVCAFYAMLDDFFNTGYTEE